QAQRPVSDCQRVNGAVGLGDRAIGLAHGDGPVARSAHHDALEDGLAADRLCHGLVGLVRGGAAGLLEAALETLDAAARVHELLLARVEGVALRADLDVQLRRGGTRHERVPAGAVNGGENVLGMDLGLHLKSRIPEAVLAATLPPVTTATGRSASI